MKAFICLLCLFCFALVGNSFGLAIPNDTKIEKHSIIKVDIVKNINLITVEKLQKRKYGLNRCNEINYTILEPNKLLSENFKFKEVKLPDKYLLKLLIS
jgi:hypothetical protein